jgi:hypothetical protein
LEVVDVGRAESRGAVVVVVVLQLGSTTTTTTTTTTDHDDDSVPTIDSVVDSTTTLYIRGGHDDLELVGAFSKATARCTGGGTVVVVGQ